LDVTVSVPVGQLAVPLVHVLLTPEEETEAAALPTSKRNT
jgi:hypothetical protein